MQRIKKRTYELIVEPPADDKIAQGVNNAILLLIAFNVVVFVLESVAPLRESYQGFFYYFEFVSVVIFSIEYVLRIWCCTHSENYGEPIRGRLRLMGTPMALIDIIAILPFYLAALGFDLRFVRILRLVRLVRLFRSGVFSAGPRRERQKRRVGHQCAGAYFGPHIFVQCDVVHRV